MTLSKDFKKGKYELYFPKKGITEGWIKWGQEKGKSKIPLETKPENPEKTNKKCLRQCLSMKTLKERNFQTLGTFRVKLRLNVREEVSKRHLLDNGNWR